MAMPNFRLAETQARWSVYLIVVALIGLGMTAYVVFEGFSWQERSIPFDPMGRFGKIRQPLVLLGVAATILVSLTSAGMGYSSLGERRNEKQSWSWLGLLFGALFAAIAVILFMSWRFLSLPIIRG